MSSERATVTLEDLLAGKVPARSQSRWYALSQPMIDQFADATLDHQFIHVDPARAKAETPFGGTIAHGFLTLSMLSALAMDAIPSIAGTTMGINYGFDKIRFLVPVRAGAEIRGHFNRVETNEKKPGELQLRHEVSVEIQGEEKPALVAEWISLIMVGKDGR
ncbi:MAG: MaoC family dehydratase [Rhizobiaceae bacterium]